MESLAGTSLEAWIEFYKGNEPFVASPNNHDIRHVIRWEYDNQYYNFHIPYYETDTYEGPVSDYNVQICYPGTYTVHVVALHRADTDKRVTFKNIILDGNSDHLCHQIFSRLKNLSDDEKEQLGSLDDAAIDPRMTGYDLTDGSLICLI